MDKKERIIKIELEGCDDAIKIGSVEPKTGENGSTEQLFDSLSISRSKHGALPLYDAPEKIIIVLDTACDHSVTTSFHYVDDNPVSPLQMLKSSIEHFVRLKHTINGKHQFALYTLTADKAVPKTKLTNRIDDVIDALDRAEAADAEDIIDMNSLLESVAGAVGLPEVRKEAETVLPPAFTVRIVLFYGRSYTLPVLERNEAVERLLEHPFFNFDVLMSHEPIGPGNNGDKIAGILQDVDRKGFSYFFSVARDSRLLKRAMVKLLAHPLQRPLLKNADYSFKAVDFGVA